MYGASGEVSVRHIKSDRRIEFTWDGCYPLSFLKATLDHDLTLRTTMDKHQRYLQMPADNGIGRQR